MFVRVLAIVVLDFPFSAAARDREQLDPKRCADELFQTPAERKLRVKGVALRRHAPPPEPALAALEDDRLAVDLDAESSRLRERFRRSGPVRHWTCPPSSPARARQP